MKKEEKLDATKEKLLNATELLMNEARDPLKVTSRAIAAKADIRLSMINYCFGSRENLIFHVFQRKYEVFAQDERILSIVTNPDFSSKDKLKELHYLVASFFLNDIQFTKAITGFVLFHRDLSIDAFSFPYVVDHYGGRKTDKECRLIAYELSSMLQLIIFRSEDLKRDWDIDLYDEAQLHHYINMRVDLLLA